MLENTAVELLAKKSGGPAQLRQIWKVQHIERDLYSVRSAYRLGMALHGANSTGVDVASLNTDLAQKEITYTFQWKISREGNYFTFGSTGTQALTMRPAEETPTAGTELTVSPGNAYVWSLEWQVVTDQILLINTQTGLPAQDAVREMELGNTATLASMNLLATFVSRSTNEQSFTWTSTAPSVATVNSETGAVTAVGRGTTKIRATNSRASNTVEFTVKVFETIYVKNFYDSTALYIKDTVPTAVAFLNHAFSEEFYLRFEMDGVNISLSPSGVDECPYGKEQPCADSCSEACRDHHKNVHRIANYLYSRFFEKNYVTVMWNDREPKTYCRAVGYSEVLGYPGAHTPLDMIALVTLEDAIPIPVVQFLAIQKASAYGSCKVDEFISLSLAHEIAHTLGLQEVYFNAYGDYENHDSKSGGLCVMTNGPAANASEFYQQVLSGESAFCDYCLSKLHSEIPEDAYNTPSQKTGGL